MLKTEPVLVVAGLMSMALLTASRCVAASEPAAESADDSGLEEIIVTAQKRQQRFNDVGVTMAVVSGVDLEKRGIKSVDDLARVVPGFTVQDSAYNSTSYTLRGVGFFNSDLATPPTVSVYLDDAPVPYPQMTKLVAFGIDHIEVLKGPQGTLFGQNVTGGAINYILAKPSQTFEAGADFGYERFNRVSIGGFISGPLSDNWLARFDLQGRTGDGWQQSNTRPGDTLGRIREAQGRLTLEYVGIEHFDSRLTLTATQSQSETPAAQLYKITPALPFFVNPVLLTQPIILNPRAADWATDLDYRRPKHLYHLTWRNDYGISDTTTLTSLSAYSQYRTQWAADFDGTPLHMNDAETSGTPYVVGGKIDSIYQELRLVGRTGKLDWLAGANYEHDKIFDSYTTLNVDFSGARVTQAFDPTDIYPGAEDRANYLVDTYGIFGRLEYHLTDSLSAEASVRYNDDRRTYAGCEYAVNAQEAEGRNLFQGLLNGGIPIVPVEVGSCEIFDAANHYRPISLVRELLHQSNVPWRVGLNWKVRDETLLYANVSKGFKAGTVPVLGSSVLDQYTPVGQESVLAYEAGVKSTLANRRVQLNAAGFYYDYRDKQLRGKLLDPAFGPLEALVTIPKSYIEGLEGQLIWKAPGGLTLNSSATYLQTKVKEFTGYDGVGDLANQSGTPFPFAPKWQAVNDISYSARVTSGLQASFGATTTTNSRSNSGIGNRSVLSIDPYTLLDVRAGLESADGRYGVTLWGKNVLNKYYWTSTYQNLDAVVRFVGMPATYGVSFSYRTGN